MATPSPQLRVLNVKKKRNLPSKGKASEEQLTEILLVASSPTTTECARKKDPPQLPPRFDMLPSDSDASWLHNSMDPTETCMLRGLLLRLVKDLEGNDCFKDMTAYVCKVLGNSEPGQSPDSDDKEPEAMWKLRCTVTRITKTSLEGKNSNVYCVAGLLHEKHKDTSSVMSGDLRDWYRRKLLGDIATTSTCSIGEDTPLNETIDLPVSELPHKLLTVEVWQAKKDGTQAKKDGTKRRSLLALLKTSDKFVGRLLHPFEKIPLEYESVTETIHSHSLKSERGDLSLQMCLVRNKAEGKALDPTAALNGYRTLFRAIVKYESRKNQVDGRSPGPTKRWSAELSAQAKQLLLSYATWNSMSVLQRAAIQLSVLLQYHKHHGVEMDACTCLMGMMQEHSRTRERIVSDMDSPISLGTGSSCNSPFDSPTWDMSPQDCGPSVQWPTELQAQLAELGVDLQDTLGRHLVLLEDNLTTVEQLRRRVVALQRLYDIRPPVGMLHEDGRTFQKTLECCVQGAIKNWFGNCSAQLALPKVGRQEKARMFCALCDACNEMCSTIQKDLIPIFNLGSFDYMLVFLEFVDKELKELCKDFLSSSYAPGDDATATSIISYRAYLTCRKIGAFGTTQGYKDKVDIALHSHQWFEPDISNWLVAADTLCKERINKAIEADEVVNDADEAKHSSSAGKVTVCLMQMVSFWKNLDWPDYEMAYGFILQMFERMCSCVHYYVKKVYNRLTDKDLHDSSGKFFASDKLCVVLNNISHVKKQLDVVCQKLDVRNLCDKLDPARGREAEENFNKLKQSTRSDIEMKLLNTARHLSDKLKPEIRKLICAWTKVPGSTCSTEVFAPLQNYIADNLQTLGDYLLDDVFQLVLASIWSVAVDCGLNALYKNPTIHHQLSHTLPHMKQLFSAEGNGLNEETLNAIPQYKVLVMELELRQLSTRDLILRCCADLAEQQAKAVGSPEHRFGELTFSVAYLRSHSAVVTTVERTKDLSKDEHPGGVQVEVWLLPQLVFQGCANEHYVSEVKSLADPVYNKRFALPATEMDIITDGSILMLGVLYNGKPQDAASVCRVCVVSCKDVPILEEQPANCNPTSLPLFVIQYASKGPLRELAYRHETKDTEASQFYQYLTQTLQVSVSIPQ